jgi:ABC transport system ATP-binding/permease protein
VPQAEVMIPELKVRESLDYRLRLRFPSMHPAARRHLVRATCSALGFGAQLDSFLEKQIGSPEWKGRYPSGGERRRINIAHELISQPLVLFLDEPTSGLASSDANAIVRLLHELARTQGLTVLMTIHQPSLEAMACIDDLLLIYRGGRPAYYGEAARAVEYFRQISGDRSTHAVHPAEYAFEFLRNEEMGAWTVRQFEEALAARRFPFLREPLP